MEVNMDDEQVTIGTNYLLNILFDCNNNRLNYLMNTFVFEYQFVFFCIILNNLLCFVTPIEWKQFGESFVSDLWQFFNNDEYSDVTISTEDGQQIKSHRILLAMCSAYFRELFKRNKGPGHISKYTAQLNDTDRGYVLM